MPSASPISFNLRFDRAQHKVFAKLFQKACGFQRYASAPLGVKSETQEPRLKGRGYGMRSCGSCPLVESRAFSGQLKINALI